MVNERRCERRNVILLPIRISHVGICLAVRGHQEGVSSNAHLISSLRDPYENWASL